jgi:GT2 family glycosyltransferase
MRPPAILTRGFPKHANLQKLSSERALYHPMMEPFSIASLTVAYNGAGVLMRQLDALSRQTRKLDEVIVVNNASTDDTVNLLVTEYPEVTVLNLPENAGVGGGYAAGLAYAALTKKYDWVWLFDQDSVPANDGLEHLLRGLEHLGSGADSTAILAPVCVHSGTKMPCPGLSWRGGRIVPTPGDCSQPITFVDLVISSGSLMRRQAIEAVGLPRADFFMDFVDYEHCLRLRRHGFKIAVVRDSHLDHVLGDPSKFKILGRTTYWTDHLPWRVYYMSRNEVFTIWRSYPECRNKFFAFYRAVRYALAVLLFGKHKLACLGMMYRGWSDGRAGKLGIRRWEDPILKKGVAEVAK